MNCQFCGFKLDDQAKFCPTCGKLVGSQPENASDQPKTEYTNPITDDKKSSLGRKLLIDSIVGLALGIVALTVFLTVCPILLAAEYFDAAHSVLMVSLPINIVGMCFSGSARAKLKKHRNLYGETSGPASVGKGISIPANIINVALMVIQALIFIFVCVMLYL